MYVLLIPLAALALFGIVKLVTHGENSAAVTSDSVDPFASTTLPVRRSIQIADHDVDSAPQHDCRRHGHRRHDVSGRRWQSPRTISFAKAPPNCIDATKTYTAEVTTNKGAYTIALDPARRR